MLGICVRESERVGEIERKREREREREREKESEGKQVEKRKRERDRKRGGERVYTCLCVFEDAFLP